MIHELKIFPEYFDSVAEKKKTFELRKNDRDFKVGDQILLREWNGDTGYTGRSLLIEIIYILKAEDIGFGLRSDYCIMSIKLIGDV